MDEIFRLLDLESDSSSTEFSKEEIALFTRRYEKGYNIKSDVRYNLWLEQHLQGRLPSESGSKEIEGMLKCILK